jgi:hypothetical protein
MTAADLADLCVGTRIVLSILLTLVFSLINAIAARRKHDEDGGVMRPMVFVPPAGGWNIAP